MSLDRHPSQRDMVRRSLDADDARLHHREVYVRHPLAAVVPQGTPTIGSLSQSIRELGEMLQVADRHPDFNGRLVEVERLADRIGERVASLRAVIRAEYLDASGGAL